MAFIRCVAAGLLSLSAACSQREPTSVTVRGMSYQFPREHVSASAVEQSGMIFVRIAPPGAKFHLVLDAFSPYLPPVKPDLPRISRLSDNRFDQYEVVGSAEVPVICSLGPRPHYNCGLSVDDGPVKWGVLFDRDQVERAGDIRQEATSAIRRYRRR